MDERVMEPASVFQLQFRCVALLYNQINVQHTSYFVPRISPIIFATYAKTEYGRIGKNDCGGV
jgi:hypothetical protein